MLLQWLVDVDGIEEGDIEAGQPHVHHDGDLEVTLRIFELTVEHLAVVGVTQNIVELFRVILATGHYHLDLGGMKLQLRPFACRVSRIKPRSRF